MRTLSILLVTGLLVLTGGVILVGWQFIHTPPNQKDPGPEIQVAGVGGEAPQRVERQTPPEPAALPEQASSPRVVYADPSMPASAPLAPSVEPTPAEELSDEHAAVQNPAGPEHVVSTIEPGHHNDRPAEPEVQPRAAETVENPDMTASLNTDAGAASAPEQADELVDLNTASVEQLNSLRGGGRIGRAIIRGRPYASAEDLIKKRVLTRAAYDAIKDQVTVR